MTKILLTALLFCAAAAEAQERERTIFSDASPTLTVLLHGTAGNAYFQPGAKAVGASLIFEGPAGPGGATFIAGLKFETAATKFSTGASSNLRGASLTFNIGWKFRLGGKKPGYQGER